MKCEELDALVKKYTTHDGQRVNLALLSKSVATKRYDRALKVVSKKMEERLLDRNYFDPESYMYERRKVASD